MKISDSLNRVDIRDKISGKTEYIEDIHFDNLHYARTLRSTIAKGRILKITYPNGYDDIRIVNHKDVPAYNEVAMIEKDMPVFASDNVNYYGEPIALIVSKNKDRIIEFMDQILIEYQEEKGVFDIEEARQLSDHIFTDHVYTRGSIENLVFDDCVEGVYETGYQEQLYMEKQGVVGLVDNGVGTVYGSLQCPYYVKNALMHCTGYSEERIRVIQASTGGAFGGKEEYPSLIACQVIVASIKVGAPVRLVFDRREDILYTTKRHPSQVRIKTYLHKEKIVGMECLMELDAGPYVGLSDVVLQRGIFTLPGCYDIENLVVCGRTLKTNNVFTGAFRGFGAPQSMFALELHMNQLAKKLKKDPIAFRRPYFVRKGMETATGGLFNEEIYLDQMADKLVALSNYDELQTSQKAYRGIGISFIPHGGGFTGNGEAEHIKAVVKLKKTLENQVEILVSNVEMGQGAQTALSKIVASVLDIEIDRVIYKNPDTSKVPDSGPTVASRTTMIVGNLLFKAAEALIGRMEEAQEIIITKNFKQPDYVQWDQDNIKGNAYMAYSWSALLAVVEVDPVTLEITTTDIYGVYDVGIPIDERLLVGQIQGGIAQGLGFGLMEQMYSEEGKILQNSFESYTVPTTCDIPQMHYEWIENRFVDGPFGAKSVGELTLVGVAPALASAVADAIGEALYQLPVTPEMLLEVMKDE